MGLALPCEPRDPSLDGWRVQIPSRGGRSLVARIGWGKSMGGKMEEDFGAVNDFPSSIFCQGRLQIPTNAFAPTWRKKEMRGCCLQKRVSAGGYRLPPAPPAHLFPLGVLELPGAVELGWRGRFAAKSRPKWVSGCLSGVAWAPCTETSRTGELSSPIPGSAALLSTFNFKHLGAVGGERQG